MFAEPRQTIAARPTFDLALREAIDVARFAPSSHNCQPWALASLAENGVPRLLVSVDATRALSALPSLATEMRLSCGMFLELLVAALAEQGFAVRVEDPPPTVCHPDTWTPLAVIATASGVPRVAAWPTALVADRRTNRAPYQNRAVRPADRDALAGAARDGVSIELCCDPLAIRAIGAFVGRNAGVDFADLRAWSETFRYIRFTDAPAVDGFALDQLFGPLPIAVRRALRLALSPRVMRFARHLGVPRVMARELGKLVARAPMLVCVSVTDDAPRTELAAGRTVMDLWMRATARGLALHPVSAVLQHDELRQRFQQLVVPRGRAVFFARVGYPTTTFPPTPRRRIEPVRL